MKPYLLIPSEFKQRNLENWDANTEFWLQSPLRHLGVAKKEFGAFIVNECSRRKRTLSVVDVGCGSAWVLDVLREHGLNARYIGIDFNERLIGALQARSDERAGFRWLDIEETPLPPELDACADVVVASFSLFEIPNINEAFRNIVQMLRPGGALFVCHIDPLTQLLSVNERRADLERALIQFGEHGASLAYDKSIELDGRLSERTYKGILYRISDYHRFAAGLGLALETFQESIDSSSRPTQQYQFAVWRAVESEGTRMSFMRLLPYTLLFLPFVVAAIVIATYRGDPNSLIGSFNRISDNLYPVSSALLALVIAGFATVLLSLVPYLRSALQTKREVEKLGTAQWTAKVAIGILFFLVAILIILLGVFALAYVEVIEAGPRLSEALEEILTFSRWLNVGIFSGFLAVDLLLWHTLTRYIRLFEVRSNIVKRRTVQNDLSLAKASVFLVDVPILALAVLTIVVLRVFQSNASFHTMRNLSFINHTVLVPIQKQTYILMLHGIESGILAASLLISQILFLALIARWQRVNQEVFVSNTTQHAIVR